MSVSGRALVRAAGERLRAAGTSDAGFDALQLFLFAASLDLAGWLLRQDDPVPPETQARFEALAARRAAGEPLQYLLGAQPFYEREFAVGPGVLIPRPETEELAALCVEAVRRRGYRAVYDLCAGSGCLGISVGLACPETEVWLFEKSAEALCYLRKNIPAGAADRLHVLPHDIFLDRPAGLPAPDLIVSNPPYIPTGELAGLQREVRLEPAVALDGGADGLDFYRRLAGYWLGLLKENGFAAFECGEGQAEQIAALLPEGFTAKTVRDAFGADRFVTAEKRPPAEVRNQ